MNRILPVVRLQLARRRSVLLVPLLIVAITVAVTVVIQVTLQRSGAYDDGTSYATGARFNPGVVWAQSGYLVAMGVASVASTFPLAASFGATRRAFALGTAVTHTLVALYLTGVAAALLALEILTGHWFGGFYVFDVNVLGAGDLGALVAQTAGGVFGAAWLRFGPRGPLGISIGVVLVLAVALLASGPSLPTVFANYQSWWSALTAALLAAAAIAGTYAFLRRASVR